MKIPLLKILACPLCRESLKFEGDSSADRLIRGVLSCTNGHLYQVNDEIPILKDPKLSEKEFVWKVEFPNIKKYDKVRKQYASYLPKQVKEADRMLIDKMANIVSKDTLMLDIASGMGTLILKVSQRQEKGLSILGVDVDEKPLRGARFKLEEQKSYGQVSLCVMDGKHLSLKQETIPYISSFFGFDNISEGMKAFQEAGRVLKPNGRLVFATLWLKEGSRSLTEAEKFGFGTIATEKRLIKTLEDTGFKIDLIETFYSGKWPYNPMDLLPYEGDWFAHSLVQAHKK